MSKELLQDIIEDFTPEKFVRFFREKNRSFAPRKEELFQYNDENIQNGIKLGEIRFAQKENPPLPPFRKGGMGGFGDEKMLICTFQASKPLSERSGKKAQYEKGKKILKDSQSDAGIFIFYDTDNNFRFSLIYAEYLGVRRRFSYFKRLTFFVSPRLTNKTFLQQIGECDFSYFESIKEAFSVEPVTKQFYGELQNWYFWAMDKIKFPDDYKYSNDHIKDKEIRNATNLIRLITRIIFIWFIAEKGLIPPELFSREKLGRTVKDFMKGKKASNFYNAILQNLFFGTLNQKMDERKLAQESGFQTNKKEYGIKNLYRYGDKFPISKDGVLDLFKDIPFLNGGLFDCLDKENGAGKVIYIDGFSRNPAKQSIIPDYLFFQQDEERVDLSNYGLGASRPVRGLIEILNSYNFTIDENTPVDQEIALDPELLGKVFENLLASYNPETATTARKATGSYYTPREIVDYMVEESLFEYLKGKLSEIEEEKIRILLSYQEEIPEFSEPERQKIILAIDDIKILDPACGSGAFPMGILHKLVYTLQKLDPGNKYWHELQYQKALKESEEVFKQDDKNERQERLKEINETFDEGINYPDYARKLYLIENCIYGVDIQPIAIQISKLRFFISLVLDQKVDRGKENLGIRALPNLETKFVSANTLIGLDRPKGQQSLRNLEIESIERELKQLRHKYFNSKTRREKLYYQKQDKKLRHDIARLLIQEGWNNTPAEQIIKFDLYDQNASADFFDTEWMFGIIEGFDVVIGNPPYIDSEMMVKTDPEFRDILSKQFKTAKGNWDIYIIFYEHGIETLKSKGILTYITPNKWLSIAYGKELRKYINTDLYEICNCSKIKVFEAGNTPIISFIRKDNTDKLLYLYEFTTDKVPEYIGIVENSLLSSDNWGIFLSSHIKLLLKIIAIKTRLKEFANVENPFSTSEAYELCNIIIDSNKETDSYFRLINTGTIDPYVSLWGIKKTSYLKGKYTHPIIEINKFKKKFPKRFAQTVDPKIIITGMRYFECYYDEQSRYIAGKSTLILRRFKNNSNPKYLLPLLNSKLISFYLKQSYSALGIDGGVNFSAEIVEQLPIPKITETAQQPFITVVDQILATKKKAPNADISALEKQIDEMVYKLYDLTPEEIAIVEGK